MFRLMAQNRNFRLMLIASLISQLGSFFSYMLLIVLSYDRTQSLINTMGVMLATSLGSLIAGSFAGVFVDRRSPIRVMIVANLLCVVIIGSLFWLPTMMIYYYAASFGIACCGAFSGPATQKCRVATTTKDEYMNANAAVQVLNQLCKIVGPGLAVFVLSLLPVGMKSTGFLIDACSYVVAACLFFGVRVTFANAQKQLSEKTKRSFKAEWIEGAEPLRKPIVANLLLLFLIIILVISGFDVLLTAHLALLGLPTLDVGYVIMALSIGLILTSVFGPKYFGKWPIWFRLGGTAAGIGIFYAGIGFFHSYWLILVSAFFVGVFNAVYNITAPTYWQENVEEARLGRFYSLVTMMISIMGILGMAVNGMLGNLLSPSIVLQGSGCVMAVIAIISSFAIGYWERRAQADGEATSVSM